MQYFGIQVDLIIRVYIYIYIFFFCFAEVAEPDAEEGEIIVEGSRDKYDTKKIVSYPGFNVPCSPDTIDASISGVVCLGYFR
jgi:hypothetical protein